MTREELKQAAIDLLGKAFSGQDVPEGEGERLVLLMRRLLVVER